METLATGQRVKATKSGYSNKIGTVVGFNPETNRYQVKWDNTKRCATTWVNVSVLTTDIQFEKSTGVARKAKTFQTELQTLEIQAAKDFKKLTAMKKRLDKRRKNFEKDLEAAFINATTVWKRTWGEATDKEIRESLESQMTREFQIDWAEFEELHLKVGKLNAQIWELTH